MNCLDKWKNIANFLNDISYSQNNKHVTCFCLPDFKPSAPSNRRKPKDLSVDTKGSIGSKNKLPRESPRSQSDSSRIVSPKFSIDGGDKKSPSNAANPNGGIFKRKELHSLTNIQTKLEKPIIPPNDPLLETPTNVIPGFGYSVVDLFENENFNMVYVLKRTENDVKVFWF